MEQIDRFKFEKRIDFFFVSKRKCFSFRSFRNRLMKFLFDIRFGSFFYSNADENVDLNENSSCWLLIEAILVRCFPQNLIVYDHHWSSMWVLLSRREKFIVNSLSSSRNESIQLDSFSILNVCSLKNDENLSFAICDDFIRTTKNILIAKHCTKIDPLVLLLISTVQDAFKLNEYEITLTEKNFFQLRTKLNASLKRKLQSLGSDAMISNNGDHCVNFLVKIFSQISWW